MKKICILLSVLVLSTVTSLMAEGDTAGAVALAETLPDRYGFTGGDLEEHGDYMRLLHLYTTSAVSPPAFTSSPPPTKTDNAA